VSKFQQSDRWLFWVTRKSFWGNLPSSLFCPLCSGGSTDEGASIATIKSKVVIGLNASDRLLPSYLWSLWSISSIFVSSDNKNFAQFYLLHVVSCKLQLSLKVLI